MAHLIIAQHLTIESVLINSDERIYIVFELRKLVWSLAEHFAIHKAHRIHYEMDVPVIGVLVYREDYLIPLTIICAYLKCKSTRN